MGAVAVPASSRTQEHATLPPEHRPVRAAGTPATAPVELPIPGWDAPSLHTGPVAGPAHPPRTGPVAPLARRPIPRRRFVVLAAVALAVVLVIAGALIVTPLVGGASPADGGSGAPTFTYRPADPAG